MHVVGAFPGSTGGPGVREAYDPATNTWTSLAPLPQHLSHVVGGCTQNIVPVATLY